MAALISLFCAAHGAEPSTGCLLDVDPALIKRVATTGLPELDRRIRTEQGFLKSLFGVDPELILMANGSPRHSFTVVRTDGKAAVLLSAAALREVWAGENRVAVVAGVLAHQYAHILQKKLKCVPEDRCEEHADLLAGWFLGRRNIAALRERADVDAVFASSLFASYHEALDTPFEQLERRAGTVRRGFDLFRGQRIGLGTMCLEGLDLHLPEAPEPAAHEEDVEQDPGGPFIPGPFAIDTVPFPAEDDSAKLPAVHDEGDERGREWVPGRYVTVEREVWIPPTCREIFVPQVIGPRAAHADPLGRFAHRMGQISEARWEKVQVPGYWDTLCERVWVEGYWR